MTILIVCGLVVGCAGDLDTDDDTIAEDTVNAPEWQTMVGGFTLVMDNNTTGMLNAPMINLQINKTYGLIELQSFDYTATHLSFEIINNTVIFHNYSFNMAGHLEQVHDDWHHSYLWNSGYAPEFGNATLHFASFPFDITVTYEVVYRVWGGRE